MRGAQRRSWIKLYVTGILHGSIRWQLNAEERATWVDLLCMAGECGKGGIICDNDSQPLPRSFIANHFNIPLELLERTLEKCEKAHRINLDNELITITNWTVYQSEYERQKPYRVMGELFDIFWDAYPKKRSKGQAERAFAQLKPDKQLLETMLSSIGRAKQSEDWLKDKGQYIPYPATWLRAKGWEDEIEPKDSFGGLPDYTSGKE